MIRIHSSRSLRINTGHTLSPLFCSVESSGGNTRTIRVLTLSLTTRRLT
jgi:hypothetical protein